MSIMKFVRALSPKVTRQKIEDNLTALRKELEQNVLPHYAEYNKLFARHQYIDKGLVQFEKALQQRFHTKDSMTVIIEDSLRSFLAGLDTVEQFVKKEFNDAVYRDAINFLQANILQYISMAAFVVRYARNKLTIVMVDEASAMGQSTSIKILDVERKRLHETQQEFINSLSLTTLTSKELERKLVKTPKAFVTEETFAVHQRNSDADPLRMNFFSTKLNPFFLYGLIEAEWEAEAYHEAKDEYAAQESLLINMQLANARENDAKLEEKIKRQLDHVQNLRRKLDEKERKYGLK